MADILINLVSVYESGRIKRQLVEEMLGRAPVMLKRLMLGRNNFFHVAERQSVFLSFFSFLLESGVHLHHEEMKWHIEARNPLTEKIYFHSYLIYLSIYLLSYPHTVGKEPTHYIQ